MVWYIELYNINCPYKIGDSKTLLEPDYSNSVKCNYPNKMYRPKKCEERACPIKKNTKFCD